MTQPRILIVTPEIASVPPGMRPDGGPVAAKAGGMADVTAGLVTALFELGADVHVALPNYRRLFQIDVSKLSNRALRRYKNRLPDSRIHLAQDSVFYYRTSVYGPDGSENPSVALRFQREVINNVLPLVDPDMIHCNDWMTGLIPAMARRLGIPCLFTVHNVHTHEMTLAEVDHNGIDVTEFWDHLYYVRMPHSYRDARTPNRVDLLASGIFAAHFANTVSPTFLREVIGGQHGFVPENVQRELASKAAVGCARGILNAPPSSFDPSADALIESPYSPEDHVKGKAANKLILQKELGLQGDVTAPVFFWPSRLDPAQKGCELLTHILYDVLSSYWEDNAQLAVVADGPFKKHFLEILEFHHLQGRLAVRDFDERLSHLCYAGSDFILMPSRFEPCGLPQMIGALYGSLPIVHDTGGLHDTVSHLDVTSVVSQKSLDI